MKPPVFDYRAARSVEEAVEALVAGGPEAKVLAGGQSLLPMMKLRLARPSTLIDINPIRELDYVRPAPDALAFGATARTHELSSALVRDRCPLMTVAADFIGYTAIRNRGTVCGSLAHGDPAAEMPLVALCLEAEMSAEGPRGRRTLAASDFFISYFTTALEADEILVEARFPAIPEGRGWAFLELSKRAGDFALVAVAVLLDLTPAGAVGTARIALGAVGDRPLRATLAERALTGQPATPASFQAAAAEAVRHLEPPSDLHASGTYRRRVAQVLVGRALAEAAGRAR
jgi:carbon-monoxide dehydrogenase medium subunit